MALCVTLSISVRQRCVLGRLPHCSVLLWMTCLNSRKWSGLHLKKAVSICHKSSQQGNTTQKWKIYPWMQFFPLSNYFLFTAGLCSPVPLQMHPQGVSGFPPEWRAMLWQSGAAGGAATSQAACTGTRQSIFAAMESCDTAEHIRQPLIFHLVQKAVTYLSQGHRCPTPPDASHQRELRNSAVINNLIYPLELIFSLHF